MHHDSTGSGVICKVELRKMAMAMDMKLTSQRDRNVLFGYCLNVMLVESGIYFTYMLYEEQTLPVICRGTCVHAVVCGNIAS